MIRIICFDDHQLVRESLAIFLNQQPGFRVAGSFETFEEFVASKLNFSEFDVALIDVMNSKCPGPQLAQQIRSVHRGCVMIALTSSEDPIYKAEMFRCGVRDYILKSVSSLELVERIRGAVDPSSHVAGQEKPERIPKLSEMTASKKLTSREAAVLALIAEGLPNLEIAKRLFVSESTVKAHVSSLISKFAVDSRSQLVAHVWRHGLD
jgi:two-component system, NarL family, response regulator LiaR